MNECYLGDGTLHMQAVQLQELGSIKLFYSCKYMYSVRQVWTQVLYSYRGLEI